MMRSKPSIACDAPNAISDDHPEHQQHGDADQQVQQVRQHAAHRAGHAVPEADVLWGFDLGRVVQRHRLLPAEAIV